MKQLFYLIPVLLLPFNHCKEHPFDRIAGGKVAKQNEFPFFAQTDIMSVVNETHAFYSLCGASLIAPQWLLTAGHCFPDTQSKIQKEINDGIKIYMGSHKRFDPKAQINRIVEIRRHPKYTVTYFKGSTVWAEKIEYDVAVAKLEKPYTLSSSVQVVSLPDKRLSRCNWGKVIGVGRENFYPRRWSDYVRYAEIFMKNRVELKGENIAPPRVDTLCYSRVQWLKGHTLGGDSGGPYVCYINGTLPVQYAIVSHAFNSSKYQAIITVFEEVGKHMEFITKAVPEVKIYKSSIKFRNWNRAANILTGSIAPKIIPLLIILCGGLGVVISCKLLV